MRSRMRGRWYERRSTAFGWCRGGAGAKLSIVATRRQPERTPGVIVPYTIIIALLLLAHAGVADAQVARLRTRTEPVGFISVGAGLFQPNGIRDGETNTEWRFDGTLQYRASIEYALRNQSAFGIAGTYARVPLDYRDLNSVIGDCARCDADATIWTGLAFF